MNRFFHNHWLTTGVLGTATSWAAGAFAFMESANVVLAFLAGLLGVVTGIFTCLVAIRRWHRGFKLEDRAGHQP